MARHKPIYISTHAPHAECDLPGTYFSGIGNVANFNSRTPRGVRHDNPTMCNKEFEFQLTHPTRSATISVRNPVCIRVNFNSRTPRGVRPTLGDVIDAIHHFNSRTPRGVRPIFELVCQQRKQFQLTHPTRSATNYGLIMYAIIAISTHAPHAECDLLLAIYKTC